VEQTYQLKKDQAACPWCGAIRKADVEFPVPMIFKCGRCGGMWVMTTPPAEENKTK